MKRIGFTNLIFLILFCLSNNVAQSQNIGNGELMFVNNTQDQNPLYIKINVYPVGAVFSGGLQYTLDSRYPIDFASNNKIVGFTKILKFDKTLPEQEWTAKINFDATSDILNCESSLGYGKYRIDFYQGQTIDSFTFSDYCVVDYSDANYGTGAFQGEQKIRIDYRSLTSLTFNFLNSTTPQNIGSVGKVIKVWEQFGNGLPAAVPSKGIFNDTSAAAYRNFPLDARDFGAIDHISPGEFSLNFIVKYPGAAIRDNQSLSFVKSSFVINEGIEIPFNQASQVSVSGNGGKFEARTGSVIIVPANFVIKVSDSADIVVTGARFTSNSSQVIWRGIRLENTGKSSSIINSEIEYADTSVSLTENLNKPFVLKSNIFRIVRTTGNGRAIFTRNCYNLLVQGNTFYLPAVDFNGSYREAAIHSLNYLNFPQSAKQFIYNIVDNTFYGGYYQLNILGFASNYVPVYISGNNFHEAFYNILARKCTGFVKDNNFVNSYDPVLNGFFTASINTNYSVLNFYGNQFKSVMYNITSGYLSYPSLAPILNQENQLVWTAGKNVFNNLYLDNIYIHNSGYLLANLGQNIFNLNDPNFRHIYGSVDDSSTHFLANGNCWIGNNSLPRIELYNSQGLLSYSATPAADCLGDIAVEDYLLLDNGYEVTNTILLSGSTRTRAGRDELLYSAALKNVSLKNYGQAINNYKELINGYPRSQYFESSVQKLYETYTKVDTIDNQNVTNRLLGDLKNFLKLKITQYSNREEFVRVAFEVLLMCETRMQNYSEALAGYEFIVHNDRDSVYRVNAAIEYAAVSMLVNGSGGSESSIEKEMRYESPVYSVLKKTFKKGGSKSIESDIIVPVNMKANELLSMSRTMNNEQLISEIENSAFGQMRYSDVRNAERISGVNDLNFSLSQNYPNPFNPSTLIRVSLPTEGIMSLIVYDISGKEVQRIANREFKESGEYSFRFDGTNLPSGIYFYTLKMNNSLQTKQMILVK